MEWFDVFSLVLNVVLGGGLLVTAVTLRSTKKMADEQAKGAEIDNDTKAAQTLVDYVVKPLRDEMKNLRRELTRFRKAVEKIPTCHYADDCPVDKELHRDDNDDECEGGNEL